MMKVLTLIVSSFILIPRSDASAPYFPICGCKPDLTKICANNGKTYDSVCEMKCDYNYSGLYVVSYGPCEDNDPVPIPPYYYPREYQPDQYQPNQYYPYYPAPYNVPPLHPPPPPSPPPPPLPPPLPSNYRFLYYKPQGG